MRAHILWPTAIALLFSQAAPADAIPAFARKYRVSCSMCHQPAPRLTEFGEQFAANGFEFQPGEEPRDTAETGDPLLRLQSSFPLAVRLDAYAQALTNTPADQAAVDLELPFGVKILSGGQLANKISYYMYFYLSERGEIAGLEDAYIQFTDIAGTGISAMVGQFQVSDPLFKRELRLQVEDYQPYRLRVGDARADLTYDRGVMLLYSPWQGADLVAEVVNGHGLSAATESRQYDRDSWKNFVLRYSQGVGPLRVGVFGYLGNERREDVDDRIVAYGPDMTIAFGEKLELNAQYLHRTDDNPFFAQPGALHDTEVDAAFAEMIYAPQGPAGRLFFTGLFNWISAKDPVFSLRLGEERLLERYRVGALGVNYMLSRNLRLTGEAARDLEVDRFRFTAGVVTAF